MVQITNPNEPHSPTMPALPGESYDKPATGPTSSSSSSSLTTTATTWTMTTLSSSSKHRPPLSSISSPQPSPLPLPSPSPSPSSSSSRPPLVASLTSYSSPPLAASSKGSGGERRNSGPGSGAPPTPPSSSRRPRQRLSFTNSPLPGSAAAAAAGGGSGGGGGNGGSGNPPPPPPPIPKLPPRSGASPRSSSSLVDMAGISVPPSSPRTVRSGISSSLPSPSSSSSPPQLPPPQGHRRVNSLPSSRAMAKKSHGTGADMASGGGGAGGAGANSNNNNADALNDLGTLTTNLEEQTNKYGVGHAKVGLAHNLIGNYHFRRGDHDQAAKHYDEALRCFESSSPTSFPSAHVGLPLGSSSSSLSSLDDSINGNGNNNNNGNGNGNGGRSAELRHQLDVAVALSNIGAVLWSTGKLTEAIETLEKCIAIRRQVEACRPPTAKEAAELSNALYSLGLARSLRGDYDDALEALNQARDALTESNSSSSSAFVEFARIEDARGKVHLLRGDADSALECHLRAFHSKLSSGVLDGPSHPSILSTRSNVAAARKALGQWDEAESVLKDVLSAQKFALYRERDTNARRRLSADVELTVQALTEVQRERAKMGRRRARSRGGSMGSMSSEIMAAIIEEKGDGIVGNMSNGKGSGDNRRLAYKNANVDSDVSLNSG